METTDGMRLTMTRHACSIAAKRGITPEVILAAFTGARLVPSEEREGQYLVASDTLTLIGVPVGSDEFRAITLKVTK